MYYFKSSIDKAKQKAGQFGKMAKDFASEIMVADNLQTEAFQNPTVRPKSQQLKEIPPVITVPQSKSDVIEDLNSSPKNKPPANSGEMINFKNVPNVSASTKPAVLEDPASNGAKPRTPITMTSPPSTGELRPVPPVSEKETALISENRKLQEKILALESKIADLESYCRNIPSQGKQESALSLQFRERDLEERKVQEKIQEILTQNVEGFARNSQMQAIQRFQKVFTSYLEAQDLEPEFLDLFLSISEAEDSRTQLFEPPKLNDLGLDLGLLSRYFQHEEEYEGLKAQSLEYERVILSLNERVASQASEAALRLAEFEGELAHKNEELRALNENLQATINANIELERSNEKLGAEVAEAREKTRDLADKLKHYEGLILAKNEESAKNMERLDLLEDQNRRLQKSLEELQEENGNLKEKEFRNQILQDQHEEIMRSVKSMVLKFSRDLAKSMENADIKEDLKRLESETTSDFSLFAQEFERYLSSIEHILGEQFKGVVENIKKGEREKTEVVMKSLSKIQADCREMVKVDKDNKQTIEQLKKGLEKTTEEKEALQSAVSIKDLKIKEQAKIINDLQENKRSFVEELKLKSKEIDKSRQALKAAEEEKEALQRNVDKLLEENRLLEVYRKEIDEKNSEMAGMQAVIEENQQEIASLNNGLHNLQVVHEETQQRNELLAKKYDNELKRLRSELEIANHKLESFSTVQASLDELEKKHQELTAKNKEIERKYKESEQEKAEIKMETNALIKKVKNETLYKENLVDKRVVCKFLVNYFDPLTTYHVKLQILETLSSILSFSNEERIKIGLHKNYLEKQLVKQNSTELGAVDAQKKKSVEEGETLKDKLLLYLMNDDEEND